MKLTKETIWHFTCDFCKLWWSFASSDEFQPKKTIFCPHCGKENKIENEFWFGLASKKIEENTKILLINALVLKHKTSYSHYSRKNYNQAYKDP